MRATRFLRYLVFVSIYCGAFLCCSLNASVICYLPALFILLIIFTYALRIHRRFALPRTAIALLYIYSIYFFSLVFAFFPFFSTLARNLIFHAVYDFAPRYCTASASHTVVSPHRGPIGSVKLSPTSVLEAGR